MSAARRLNQVTLDAPTVIGVLAVAILISVGSLSITVKTQIQSDHTTTALRHTTAALNALDKTLITRCTARTPAASATLALEKKFIVFWDEERKINKDNAAQQRALSGVQQAEERAIAVSQPSNCQDYIVAPLTNH